MLKYDEHLQYASINFCTYLAELKDVKFHGMYREGRLVSDHTSALLHAQPVLGTSLEQQYQDKFLSQDAIARTAIGVAGYEYADHILSFLQEESARVYGNKAKYLPPYATESIQVMFGKGKREKILSLQEVQDQIHFVMTHTEKECDAKQKNETSHKQCFSLPRIDLSGLFSPAEKQKKQEQIDVFHFPELPWVSVEQADGKRISLALDQLKIDFAYYDDKIFPSWQLLVINQNKRGFLLIEAREHINAFQACLKQKDINQLLSMLSRGVTAKQMRTLLIDGISTYQAKHDYEGKKFQNIAKM